MVFYIVQLRLLIALYLKLQRTRNLMYPNLIQLCSLDFNIKFSLEVSLLFVSEDILLFFSLKDLEFYI